MGARFRSWWQQIKTHPVGSVLIALVIALVVLVILGGYLFHWDWAGFNGKIKSGKTLWDWLQLLIIPAVLAFGGFVINLTISRSEQEATKQRAKTEREIADDNQSEAALQGYSDKMSELLLHEKLRESQQTDEVRTLARVRTLTVLPRLDGKRKGSVLQFLHEAKLINQDKGIISLEGANLRETNLFGSDLTGANLYKADLFGADLTECLLNKANLIETNLSNANLSNADLRGASLFQANLTRANLTRALLVGVNLSGANISRVSLFGAFLVEADLGSADLSRADPMGADLGGANLNGADLSKTILRETNLTMVNLSGADLTGADLLGAKIDQKRLDQAKSLKAQPCLMGQNICSQL